MISDPRKWWFYAIPMPVNKDGYGPAEDPEEFHEMFYEVWDCLYETHYRSKYLADAIQKAIELNEEHCEVVTLEEEVWWIPRDRAELLQKNVKVFNT